MQKIQLTSGVWRFKSVPLYRGVKIIDKDKAADNLKELKIILEKYNIDFQLAYGTLLGAVRDHDFISHDEDIDLIILSEQKQQFLDILPVLHDNGFDVVRYDKRDLLSVMRNGEYIDFYFFRPLKDGLRCSGCELSPDYLIENTVDIEFKGNKYKVPAEYEDFLLFEYGDNWRTPIQWADFEVPKWKRALFKIKDSVKGLLPDSLYLYIAKRSNTKLRNMYIDKVERYREILKKRAQEKNN